MSQWKVTSNYIGETPIFAVYRIRREGEVDHSGNREYIANFFSEREIAQRFADALNGTQVKKICVTYRGTDSEYRDCENAISFSICKIDPLTNIASVNDALAQIARHHGYQTIQHNKHFILVLQPLLQSGHRGIERILHFNDRINKKQLESTYGIERYVSRLCKQRL